MQESWSQAEAVTWIIYRRLKAVEFVGKIVHCPDPVCRRPSMVVAMIAARKLEFQTRPHRNPARRVNAAARLLRWAETKRGLAPDQQGSYSADRVKSVFPPREGKGRGQQKRAFPHEWKIHKLGLHMLTAPRPDKMEDLYEWCLAGSLDERLIGRREQFAPLRRKALAWAEEELAARVRAGVGVRRAAEDGGKTWIPLSEDERKECEANLRAWKQPSRGWKNRSRR